MEEKLEQKVLINIIGGGFNAPLINALARGLNTLIELGRSFGTSLRMIISGIRCS